MRERKRICRIQDLISNIWIKYPDLRYWQLLENLYSIYSIKKNISRGSIYYMEDSDWEEFLINFKGFE